MQTLAPKLNENVSFAPSHEGFKNCPYRGYHYHMQQNNIGKVREFNNEIKSQVHYDMNIEHHNIHFILKFKEYKL